MSDLQDLGLSDESNNAELKHSYTWNLRYVLKKYAKTVLLYSTG